MKYPTMEMVEEADRMQLARCARFLDSPGMSAVRTDNFHEVLEEEAKIGRRIFERFTVMGGMTPEISKAIGWN